MSVFAINDWGLVRNSRAAGNELLACPGETSMRNKLTAVRDTVIVLGLQVVLRVMLVLRRLNY